MQYDPFFQFASSVPSWSKQHPGLRVEVDTECQDCQLIMIVLQSKQLLHSDLQPFENHKFQMAVQDLFANHWNLHQESQLMTSKMGNVCGLNDAVPRLMGLVLRPRSDRLVPEVISGI